jgi:MYXO-CTERM domain-containing protein
MARRHYSNVGYFALALVTGCAPASSEPTLAADRSALPEPGYQKLTAADASHFFGGDRSGAIAMSGDALLIGDGAQDDSAGAAYVFVNTASVFSESQKLLPSTRQAREKFGAALAVSGDKALVGAHQRDDARGAVFFFARAGSAWEERQIITASDGVADDHFGMSLWMSGDSALIAAPFTRGLVYAFNWNGSAWIEQGKLSASDGATLGGCISGSSDAVVVCGGASAHVFVRSSEGWIEQQRLTPPAAGGVSSAAIFGDRILLGASLESPAGPASGAGYVFTRSAGTWEFHEKLLPEDGIDYANFGASVAVDSRGGIIGSPGWARFHGKVYVYSPEFPGVPGSLVVDDFDLGGLGRAVAAFDGFRFVAGSSADVGAVYAFRDGKRRGASCSSDEECLSLHCLDGMCCDAACDGACAACSVARGASADGYCEAAPAGSGEPVCGTLVCDGLSMDCVPCASDSACTPERYCAHDNTCQPRKPIGSSCNSTAEAECAVAGCRVCLNSHCTDGSCQESTPDEAPTSDGGCGCRTAAGADDSARTGTLLLLGLALLAFRQRSLAKIRASELPARHREALVSRRISELSRWIRNG